jgi:peptidoglycan/LPS O-acetylase OafA/YrhL
VLDGMRGVAILLVMLMHTGLLKNGYIGVDVFFGLSGFLITTLLYEEWDRTGAISFRAFYERRARRLLPALFLVVAAFALIYVVFNPFNGWPLMKRVVPTLLFANNWVVGLGHQHDLGVLSPTWSLAQEEQFYLLWPLFLWLMLRAGLRPAIVLGLLTVAIVGLLLSVPHVETALPAYDAYFSPLDRAAELLLGCAGAVMWRNGWVPWPLRWRVTQWALIAAFLWVLLHHEQILRITYLLSVAIAVPLIVSLLSAREGLVARVLSLAPLRYVGKISYCLYLCNLLIHNLVSHYLPNRSVDFYAAITFAASFAVAGLSWHVIESRAVGRHKRFRMPRELIPVRVRIRAPQPSHAR